MALNYKKIIKSRNARLAVLRLLKFVPDKAMLGFQYRIKMGKRLDLINPQSYSEKIQWYKLYYRDPKMIRCVDKYDVREYLEEIGCSDLLVKCYGIFDSAESIDFSQLPNSFVMKDTLGGGGNSVILVHDKHEVDEADIKNQLKKWLDKPVKPDAGREWPYYSGKKHRILIEELLSDKNHSMLTDYKFLCFNGEVFYLQIFSNRKLGDSHLEEGFFDKSFRQLNVCGIEHRRLTDYNLTEDTFNKLKAVATRLCKGFPHVRVDLYFVNGKTYFGELTFFPASGYKQYTNEDFDYELGKNFVLPEKLQGTT